jgi:hypothetical protein
MTIKKTVTEKVIAANRANSAKSTGPRTTEGKRTVSVNAEKDGLWAKRRTFTDPEEGEDFEQLITQLQRDPRRAMIGMLNNKLAWAVLHSGRVRKEMEAFPERRAKSNEILRQLLEQSNDVVEGTDLITGAEFSPGPLGWDCDLVLKTSRSYSNGHDSDGKSTTRGLNQLNRNPQIQSSGHSTDTDSIGRWEFEGKLTSPEDRILRRYNSLSREIFQTIATLLVIDEKEEEQEKEEEE